METPGPRGRLRRRLLQAVLAAGVAAAAGAGMGEPGGAWSLYLDYTFTAESASIRDADRTKARRVADHLAGDSGLRVGLDGMHQGRVSSVRDALVHAGIPPSKIQAGAFAEPRMRGERRVLVMIGR